MPLDALAHGPDDVLLTTVTRDGSCMPLSGLDHEPERSGEELTDRQMAARICAGCPVQRHCLELVLSTAGGHGGRVGCAAGPGCARPVPGVVVPPWPDPHQAWRVGW